MEAIQTLHCPALHKNGADHQKRVITIQVDQTGMSNTPSKTLKVVITCDDDPFSHHVLTLREESFSALRAAQGLLVEFTQFPRKFCELLQQCITEAAESCSPRFCLHMDTSQRDALLEVVEVNPFRQLSHLALRLAAASDADLKQYLAKALQTLKESVRQEQERLNSAERSHSSQLRHTQELLAQRSDELEQLRGQLQQLSASSGSQLQHQLSEEREKARQAQWELKQKHELERRTAAEAHQQAVAQLEQRAATLDRQCRQLTETKYKHELHVRELETQLKSLETEHRQLKQEATAVRRQNASLDEEYHGKSKAVQQLKTRVAVLETEARDQQQLLQRQEQLHQAATQNKDRLESQLTELQSTLSRRENTVKTVSQDLLKANDIIRKLQAETRANHAKLKMRSQIALEQERLLSEAAEERRQLQQRAEEAEARQKAGSERAAKLQTELSQLQTSLDAANKLHKTNENVINWLNKQLTEQQSQPRPTVPRYTVGPRGLPSSVGTDPPSTSTPLSGYSVPPLRQPPDSTAQSPATGIQGNQSDPLPSRIPSAVPLRPRTKQDENRPPALAARYLQASKADNVRIAGLVRRAPPTQ